MTPTEIKKGMVLVHIPTQERITAERLQLDKTTGEYLLNGLPLGEFEPDTPPKVGDLVEWVGCPYTLSYIKGWEPIEIRKIEGDKCRLYLVDRWISLTEVKVIKRAAAA